MDTRSAACECACVDVTRRHFKGDSILGGGIVWRSKRNQEWSERHSGAVREAAPEVPAFSASEQVALWGQIEVTATTPRASRPRWRRVVAGMVAVGVVGVGGAATAGVFSAHTGRGPVDAEDVELGGPGERLNPQAPDLPVILEEATRDIRFPSVQARDSALSWEVEDQVQPSSSERTLVSIGALRLWMAGHALCSWSNTWAVALRTGDTHAEKQAADVILGARDWPSITDTDPDLANESEFAWLPDLERAVRLDDPSAAKDALFPNGACMPGLAPELGLGRRW